MRTCIFRLCAALLALTTLVAPLASIQKARAASVTLAINGSQVYQTIDGFGVNANSASWNGTELIPVIDNLINNGSTIWRVVIDDQDWEATNDDADPNNYNWTAYNVMYSSPKFEKLWSMIAYLNSRGAKVILCPMGKAANWMGGLMLTTTDTIKNEYAEMIASMAIYGATQRGLQFALEPNNEPDIETEGVRMSAPVQAEEMNKIAVRLDAAGLSGMRMMGPSAGVIQYAVTDFTNYMHNYPTLMAHVDAYSYHDYNGTTGNAASIISNSAYSNKKFYMTEFSQFDDGMAMLGQGPQALLVWDGYDSVYNHPLDRNGSATAPNDAGDGPALLAYDSSTHTYTPRKEFYQFAQLFKYVPAGSVRIGATSSGNGVTSYAFRDNASSRLTIVGKNASSSTHTLTISLNNVGVAPPVLSYFQTNASSNMTPGADVSVTSGVATVTVPANTIFTLTGLGIPDTEAPSIPGNLTGSATSATSANLSWSAATDNTSVANYIVKRNGTPVGQSATTSYSDTGLTAETTYTYTVQAKDMAGNLSPDSSPISITTPAVPADTTAPTVAFTTPAQDTTISGTVAVNATASDDVSVVGVQFKLDGANLGIEDTTSPYGISWDTTTVSNGVHTLTATASDVAGNSTVATVQFIVNNTATSLALDKTVSTNQTTASGTITSPKFSTAQPGELLVAFISSDGPSNSAQTYSTVTGGGLTWTLRKRVNTRAGTSEIWTAYATSTVTNAAVTAKRSKSGYVGSITIAAFMGARSSIGAVGGNNGASGAQTVSLTTTKAGSIVWGVGNDWDGATARTIGSNQTMVNQYLASVGDTFWVQRVNNPSAGAGQIVTLNDTAPTNHRWNYASIEVVPQ